VRGLLLQYLWIAFTSRKVYVYTPMTFWYVYVLRSLKDRMFYIGSTDNLKRRFQQHQHGQNISTAKRLPLELLYFEGHRSKEDAIRRDKYFKTTNGKVTLRQVLRLALDEADGLGEGWEAPLS
jgi:putative endonuclease